MPPLRAPQPVATRTIDGCAGDGPVGALLREVESYLKPRQVREVRRACELVAARPHGHPEPRTIEVARILAAMHVDPESLVAALLHETAGDDPTFKSLVARRFGAEAAELVEGIGKLTQVTFDNRAEAQAENFRKMLLAMARDIRVILVKLAERLHAMRTLAGEAADKRRQAARETLEIYVPIAQRLGLNSIRLELEDLGFAALYPKRYRVLADEVRRARGHRKQVVEKIRDAIERRLREEGLEGEVLGREKHLYSLYRKMQRRGLSFSEVLDVYAFRIIVDSVDTCYRVLGVVHNLYKPLPGKFKDYVAIPKANGYQSLHTVLFGPYGVPVEVQIRTAAMHAVAESGIAAHWLYKSGETTVKAAEKRARQWLRELLELHKQAGNPLEFIEQLKIDLFPDEVYVFTPAGDIMALPRGATAVDLAYAIHSDVGNTCVAVKVDRRYVPLSTPLVTGQTVEVVNAPWGQPSPNWLNFVVTGKARANIRSRLKTLRRSEAIELGRRLLEQSLAVEGLSLAELPKASIEGLLAELEADTLEDLLEDIGLGKRIAPLIVRRLVPENAGAAEGGTGTSRPLPIRGTEGMVVSFAKCCHPIPGDPILGFVSAGRGVVIHTQSCKNLGELLARPQKWIDVTWAPDVRGDFPVEIRLDVVNQRGVLATVAATIAEAGVNIDNIGFNDRDGLHSSLKFVLEVESRTHLARLMRRLRALEEVNRIQRTRG